MSTIYWAVYPSGQADPTAAEIINETVPNGFFGNDVSPTGDTVGFQGAPITGLAPSTSYKLAGVWSDAANDSNVDITAPFVTEPLPVDLDVTPITEALTLSTPTVDVEVQVDTNVVPITEAVTIAAPSVSVSVGQDVSVVPTEETLTITTPTVDVQVLLFTNVDVLPEFLTISTPTVEVEIFKDTTVVPIKAPLRIATPTVDVAVGIDLDVTPITEALKVSTDTVSVTTEVQFLVATEAQPLEYNVTVGGDVQMTSNPDAAGVLAWRNEHGGLVELDPFPAVLSSQPSDTAVSAPNAAGFSVTATGAASFQWYVDDVAQLGETASTFIIPVTTVGVYQVRCMAINASGIGISSKAATLTVS